MSFSSSSLMCLFVGSSVFAQGYRVDALTLGSAHSIDQQGRVAGYASDGYVRYPYVWSEKEGVVPLSPPSSMLYLSISINNRSEVVAAARETWGLPYCLIKWTSGQREQLPICTTADRLFHGPIINDQGQIVFTQDGHAIRLDPDGKITTFGESESYGTGLNDRGNWVGYYNVASNRHRAFIHTDESGFRELPLPEDALSSWADAISENGIIAGRVDFGDRIDAVIWRGESMVNITRSSQWPLHQPATVNSSGTVILYIGFDFLNLGTFVYSDETGLQPLNGLLPAGWSTVSAHWSINDDGQIAGTGYGHSSGSQGVRLVPIE